MNIFLKILIFNFFVFTEEVQAQKKAQLDLILNFPKEFKCDTVFISSEQQNKNRLDTITEFPRNKTFLNYFSNLSKTNKFISIFFKTNNYQLNDTLFLLYQNNTAIIDINDSEVFRKTGLLWKIKNLYNFEELYAKFLNYYAIENKLLNKYYENKNLKIDKLKLLQKRLMARKFEFIELNFENPYSIDIFSEFLVKDNSIGFVPVQKFYSLKLKSKIRDQGLRNFIELAIKSKKITTEENVKAPTFTFQTLNDEVFNSDQLRGNFLLINFGATWCSPCNEELPFLKEIYEKYKAKKFKIISISLDRNKIQLLNFIKKNEIKWMNVFGDQNAIRLFGINPIPHLFLINPSGVIIYNSITRKVENHQLIILNKLLETNIK